MDRIIIRTGDGSDTIVIPEMNVSYHSKHGAIQESRHIYMEAGLRFQFDRLEHADLIRIFEMGFVAGLGPFPYMILSKKKQQSKIKDSAKLKIEKILQDENLEFTIFYIDVQKIVIKRGSNSVVRNMLGSFITKNYLTIFTKANNKYEYVLSIKKNGDFSKMVYWMKSILPVEISLVD